MKDADTMRESAQGEDIPPEGRAEMGKEGGRDIEYPQIVTRDNYSKTVLKNEAIGYANVTQERYQRTGRKIQQRETRGDI